MQDIRRRMYAVRMPCACLPELAPKHGAEVVALLHARPCGVTFDNDYVYLFQFFLKAGLCKGPHLGPGTIAVGWSRLIPK